MFAQTELARAVLRMLMAGHAVPTHHAIQLRNWAVCSEDSVLPLEEIARRILGRAGSVADSDRNAYGRSCRAYASRYPVAQLGSLLRRFRTPTRRDCPAHFGPSWQRGRCPASR